MEPMKFTKLMIMCVILAIWFGNVDTKTWAQNASTGAVTGTVIDSTRAVVPGAEVTVVNEGTGEVRKVTTGTAGTYLVPLLPPGSYRVEVSKGGFKLAIRPGIPVVVAEAVGLDVQLEVGSRNETVVVQAAASQIQTESAELGNVTDSRMISDLPLASRNYLQIIGLNPGVSAEVTNAGDLGRGASSTAQYGAGFSANGVVTDDNNFKMNGVEVNDNFAAGVYTGGVPTPNPDTLQEFKVVTAPYDASNGRNSGASVDVLTKTGTNDLHGTLFEFFRNNVLDANEWFNKEAGNPTPILKQNQFGGTIGGHIVKNKLLYFGSYQGTRQRNGVDPNCAVSVFLPPLTNDRSAAGLGALFAGQRGAVQNSLGGVGPAIAADGSNINPVALTVLQMKGPNGGYLIPTPQIINPGASSFDAEGTATYSVPCPFTSDQFMTNMEYNQNQKSRFDGRFFFDNDLTTRTLNYPNNPGSTVPGFPWGIKTHFRNFSLTHTYVFNPNLLNQFQFGFNRLYTVTSQAELFSWSDLGATVPSYANAMPGLAVANVALGGLGQDQAQVQNTWVVEDSLAWVHGRHALHFGGGITRNQMNAPFFNYFATVVYQTFADFLLGLDANDNGTAAAGDPNSNELYSVLVNGQLARFYRYYDVNAYVQDNFRVASRLTINWGVRFERLGDYDEITGKNVNLDLSKMDPNPPPSGTLAGYTVPSNFTSTVPPGVIKAGNTLGITGQGQNGIEPRIGFAWQLPRTNRVVLHGGYGLFRSHNGGVGLSQSVFSPPFSAVGFWYGTTNAAATAQNPFPSSLPTLPAWVPYSPSTSQEWEGLDQDYQPALWHRYSSDLQMQLARDFTLDVGYVGGRASKLVSYTLVDQAELASPTNPIRGQTTNTIVNIPLRVPYEGFSPSGMLLFQPIAIARYNALQASLSKRFSSGLQFLASYTFARDLTDLPGVVTGGGFGGSIYGDQTHPMLGYGPDTFIRPHRFVVSYLYQLPSPGKQNALRGKLLGGWAIAGVTTVQSGHPDFAVNTGSSNAYGISQDRPDYIPGCAVNKSGSIQHRLNSDFNTNCFTTPPVIGDDGVATALGNAPTGNIHGPDQVDFDLSILKRTVIKWPNESANIEFRTDFFNIMNHPMFGDPSTNFAPGSPFGQIGGPTVVNPRVIQFALKYSF